MIGHPINPVALLATVVGVKPQNNRTYNAAETVARSVLRSMPLIEPAVTALVEKMIGAFLDRS